MAEYINKADAMNVALGICFSSASINLLNNLPTIDIVHCYKCKHYEKCTEYTGFCNHFETNVGRLVMEYDWFCADGERFGGNNE